MFHSIAEKRAAGVITQLQLEAAGLIHNLPFFNQVVEGGRGNGLTNPLFSLATVHGSLLDSAKFWSSKRILKNEGS
jgi:hypothetical protein